MHIFSFIDFDSRITVMYILIPGQWGHGEPGTLPMVSPYRHTKARDQHTVCSIVDAYMMGCKIACALMRP